MKVPDAYQFKDDDYGREITEESTLIPLAKAKEIAGLISETFGELNVINEKILSKHIICGGVRREIQFVHDIDIVYQIRHHQINPFQFNYILTESLYKKKFRDIKNHKTKITMKYPLEGNDIVVEMFRADNEREYEVLKLIRTGNHRFNRLLAQTAIKNNWTLRFSDELFGIYGTAKYWNDSEGCFKYVINPLRSKWKEEDIIVEIFGKYLLPSERNY